jgi:hypothetical protein
VVEAEGFLDFLKRSISEVLLRAKVFSFSTRRYDASPVPVAGRSMATRHYDLQLIKNQMLSNMWQDLHYRLEYSICRSITDAHT